MPSGVVVVDNLEAALDVATTSDVEKCFVAGGGMLYKECLSHPNCHLLYLTEVQAIFDCDTFFPEYEQMFELQSCSLVYQENDLDYCYKVYRQKNNKALESKQ